MFQFILQLKLYYLTSSKFLEVFDCLIFCLLGRFLLMADFDAYLKCQERVNEAFRVSLARAIDRIKYR